MKHPEPHLKPPEAVFSSSCGSVPVNILAEAQNMTTVSHVRCKIESSHTAAVMQKRRSPPHFCERTKLWLCEKVLLKDGINEIESVSEEVLNRDSAILPNIQSASKPH